MLKHYLDMTALVPVYEVSFLPSLDVLPVVLDGIVEALGDVARAREGRSREVTR
jgi:hypothetical protein